MERAIRIPILDRRVNWTMSPIEGAYIPDEAAPLLTRLVSRAAHWFLRRHGVVIQESLPKTHVKTITASDLRELLARQQDVILRHDWSRSGQMHVLMGPDDYADLAMALTANGPITVALADSGFRHSRHGRTEVLGMKITLVPWMDGIVVLPSDIREIALS